MKPKLRHIDLSAFGMWLTERGAEILAPRADYEAFVFRYSSGLAVIYAKRDRPSYANPNAMTALRAYWAGEAWRAQKVDQRQRISKSRRRAVFERDQASCVYCDSTDNLTIDHVVAITAGGTDHVSNLVTCCRPCNELFGAMPAGVKIRQAIRRAAACAA